MYELWDRSSGNLIETFETRTAALAEVARIADEREMPVDALLLGHEDARGRTTLIAQGAELLRLTADAGSVVPRHAS